MQMRANGTGKTILSLCCNCCQQSRCLSGTFHSIRTDCNTTEAMLS